MFRPDVVLAFAFGAPAWIESNRRLARLAVRSAKTVPIFTQQDLLTDEVVEYRERLSHGVIVARQKEGEYLPTLGVVWQFLRHAIATDWRSVIVVAAPPHISRCLRDCRREAERMEGLRHITFAPEPLVYSYFPERGWFCAESAQAHTRAAWRWWFREIPLRMTPYFLYRSLTLRSVRGLQVSARNP